MEKELRQAFEETANRNIKMILDHSNKTRKLTNELQNKITQMDNQIRIQNTTIDQLRNQLAIVQSKIYAGGS